MCLKTILNVAVRFDSDCINAFDLFAFIHKLLEVVVQTTTYIQFAFVVLHSRGGSWELVDAFSLCCLTWHFWKILGE